jgi:hypothetical protein
MLSICFDIEENRANVSLEEIQQKKCYSSLLLERKTGITGTDYLKKTMKKKLHFTNYGVCGLFSITQKKRMDSITGGYWLLVSGK